MGHHCLCCWLHAHIAQVSDPRSSRRDSAHAVYWVRLHPHCFLHPLHFGAATLMWVKVMWLSIVEYLFMCPWLISRLTHTHCCLTPEWHPYTIQTAEHICRKCFTRVCCGLSIYIDINLKIHILFWFFRTKTRPFPGASQSRLARAKVLPVPKAPVGPLVHPALW